VSRGGVGGRGGVVVVRSRCCGVDFDLMQRLRPLPLLNGDDAQQKIGPPVP